MGAYSVFIEHRNRLLAMKEAAQQAAKEARAKAKAAGQLGGGMGFGGLKNLKSAAMSGGGETEIKGVKIKKKIKDADVLGLLEEKGYHKDKIVTPESLLKSFRLEGMTKGIAKLLVKRVH